MQATPHLRDLMCCAKEVGLYFENDQEPQADFKQKDVT